MASAESQSVFSRLHNYHFLEDKQFLSGWTRVRDGLADADQITLARKFLEAKVFYFSRFIQEVSLNDYIIWLEGNQGEIGLKEKQEAISRNRNSSREDSLRDQVEHSQKETTPDEKNTTMDMGEGEEQDTLLQGRQSPISPSLDKELKISDNSGDDKDKDSTDDQILASPQYPETFHDIVEMVQKGLPLPGVQDLNIEPTNTPPTKPCAYRITKPWEKDG